MIEDQELMEQWLKVAKRVQSVVPDGHAVVSIKVYIHRGKPAIWTEPTVVKVEPKASDVMAALGA